MIDRRSFVKLAAGAALGTSWGLGRALASQRRLERIGLQLYTVRTLMQEDFAGTLQAVAAAGYDEVEFAGYFGHEPEAVRALLDRLGLAAPGTHVPLEALRADLAGTIAHAAAVGHGYLVCPWLAPAERGSIERYRELAAFLDEVGGACRDAGLRFAWHNHEFELQPVDGEVPLDVLLAATDPERVDFELDIYWTVHGGGDPLAYFERHPGRFPLWHLKDRTAAGEMVDVGAGAIDFAALFAHAEQAGLRHCFVEHDAPPDPLASIAASHDHLRALSF